jgi:heme-degrading monooxygenase HmoA
MSNQRIYRVDKFHVPEVARAEFIEKVMATQQVLRTVPGFVEDTMLEQTSGPGRFNFITIVVWENAAVMEGARQAVVAKHQAMGFNPAELFERLGIEADLANYQAISL